jgi:hypothetical protein
LPENHGPQRLSLDPARSSPPVPNTTDVLELEPSSRENSDADDDDPQIPGISPLQIGDNVLGMDPSLNQSFYCLDPRFPGLISSHIAFIACVEYIRAKKCPSECECWKRFGYETRFSHHGT